MFTGKGGVGKTSLAAATGVKLAELNYRTLVMSIDPAHSLGDSFDLGYRPVSPPDFRPIGRSPTSSRSLSSTFRRKSSGIGRKSLPT